MNLIGEPVGEGARSGRVAVVPLVVAAWVMAGGDGGVVAPLGALRTKGILSTEEYRRLEGKELRPRQRAELLELLRRRGGRPQLVAERAAPRFPRLLYGHFGGAGAGYALSPGKHGTSTMLGRVELEF